MPKLVLRNPLALPADKAGFDPNHIALSGGATCFFSGVARRGNFIDLTRGVAGSVTGAPTRVVDGHIGDSVQYAAAAGNTFAGRATTAPRMTFGAVVKWTNIAAGTYSFIFANSTNTTGYNALFGGSDGSLNIRYGGINWGPPTSAITLVNNVPYFVAASIGPNANFNFVAARLDNGQVRTGLAGPASASDTPNGTYVVGNWPLMSSFGIVGKIAAVAYLNGYMAMPQLIQWAAAPWDFWYPPTQRQLVMSTVGPVTAAAAPAAQARVMVMA